MALRFRMLILLLATGCAGGGTSTPDALLAAAASAEANLAVLAPAPATVPTITERPRATLRAATFRPRPAPAAAEDASRPATAAQLLGAAPTSLRRWLGEPALRRAEGHSEIWLYTGTGCAVDVVLYRDAGGLRVAHAAARSSGAAPVTEGACLRQIGSAAGAPAIPAAGADTPQPLPAAARREPGA